MRIWAPVFHFYQPPTQDLNITSQVLHSNYLPFLDALLENPNAHVTFNLTGSLTVQLQQLDAEDFFDKVKELVDRGQVDILNTPLYHPLLPFTKTAVIHRQIEQNHQITRQFYNIDPIEGIYPPELAINPDVLNDLAPITSFVLVDESAISDSISLDALPQNMLGRYGDLTLAVSARALTEILRSYQEELTATGLVKFFHDKGEENTPIISVNDVELFGHHYQGRLEFLKDLFAHPELTLMTLTEVIERFPDMPEFKEINPSTWETTNKDKSEKNYYPLWLRPGNELQKQYLELIHIAEEAFETVAKPNDDINLVYASAEGHFDQGISSCHLFWLSNYPWWHPDLVEAGAYQLIKSVRTLAASNEIKRRAEILYSDFIKALWLRHWSGEVQEHFDRFDSDRVAFYQNLPKLES